MDPDLIEFYRIEHQMDPELIEVYLADAHADACFEEYEPPEYIGRIYSESKRRTGYHCLNVGNESHRRRLCRLLGDQEK